LENPEPKSSTATVAPADFLGKNVRFVTKAPKIQNVSSLLKQQVYRKWVYIL